MHSTTKFITTVAHKFSKRRFKLIQLITDACDIQLGSVVSQNGKLLACCSRKLNAPQKNYTTHEKELLSIVGTLKEFNTILFGHKVVEHTNHKNLTHETELVSSPRVMQWRLLLEEYKISLKYIKGFKKIKSS